jgi:uncharacterized protein involved in exopolysaccharide biosynthesis
MLRSTTNPEIGMKTVLKFVAKLYPTWWRARYGIEFSVLLEEANPTWWDVPNILKGAIEMQMSFSTRAFIALACGIIGALVTFGASFLMQPKYKSTATFAVPEPIPSPQLLTELAGLRDRSALANIIQTRGLYPRERASQPIAKVLDKMNFAIMASPTSPHILTVSFIYEDAALAQQAANDLAARLTDLEVLDPPSLPRKPVSPAPVNMAIFGMGAGLLSALVLLVILPSPRHPQPA